MIGDNGIMVKGLAGFVDTGASLLVTVNESIAKTLKEKCGIKKIKLARPIPVKGFKNGIRMTITDGLVATMRIDGYRFRIPVLVCDTDTHSIFLGRKFFELLDVLVDCKNRRLIWPRERTYQAAKEIVVPSTSSRLNPVHQGDADERDRRMDREIKEEKRRRHLQHKTSSPKASERQTRTQDLRKMRKALHPPPPDPPPPPKKKCAPTEAELNEVGLDVCCVEARGFLSNCRRKDVVIGMTSIYEIERLIQEARDLKASNVEKPPDSDTQEEELWKAVQEKLPQPSGKWTTWADCTIKTFSQKDSDTLPPHREGVDHKIELEEPNPLTTSPLYSMSNQQLELVKDYITDHLRKGFIVPSKAWYGSPVLFAKKPGGGWRFCVDYRKLNTVTKKDRYPIPLIDETMARLSRAKVFTKLDIRQAFYRIRMDKKAEDLTTFRTRYGSFKYKVLPFGLCNGPASFQRYINSVLHDYLDDFATAYIDDVLIYSEDPLEHETHVYKVVKALEAAGLQADIRKSEFQVTETKYLGFIIGTTGIRKDPGKVEVVRNWETPASLKGLQSFLGFSNYYSSFIDGYQRIIEPLNKRNRGAVAWRPLNDLEKEAFERLKSELLSDQVLALFDPRLPGRVECDASNGVIAAVFYQLQSDGRWRPVAFWSKTLQAQQMNYEIHDKEMLAVVEALKHWRNMLIGLQATFTVYTDHRALEYFTVKRLLNPRQARWSELLADYHFKITYWPGTSNKVADALSRKQEEVQTQKAKDIRARTATLLKPEVVIHEVAPIKGVDDQLWLSFDLIYQVLKGNREHPTVTCFHSRAETEPTTFTLRDGLLLRKGRLVVPAVDFLRTAIIKACHATQCTAHPGKTKTKQLVTKAYWWPDVVKDCEAYVDNCKQCHWSHRPRDKTPGLLHPLPIPDHKWQHVTMDFHDMPRDKNGYDRVFVCVDRFGKRAFSLPTFRSVTGKDAAELYYKYIYRIFGAPETATSDRGSQFTSAFMDELCKLTGIKQRLSSAYHPQTDGQTDYEPIPGSTASPVRQLLPG